MKNIDYMKIEVFPHMFDDDKSDYLKYKYHTRKGIYEDWDYQEELEDD